MRLLDGVRVAESPWHAIVPFTRLSVFGVTNSLKVALVTVLQRIRWLKVTETVASRSTLRSPGTGLEVSTSNFPNEAVCTSTFCAPARPAIHMTSNNMVIEILVTMTLSLTMPDALQTKTSTAPQDGNSAPVSANLPNPNKARSVPLQRLLSA